MPRSDPERIDLVVVNSVVQSFNEEALGARVHSFRPVVAPKERIVFADVVPREARALDDVRARFVFGACPLCARKTKIRTEVSFTVGPARAPSIEPATALASEFDRAKSDAVVADGSAEADEGKAKEVDGRPSVD